MGQHFLASHTIQLHLKYMLVAPASLFPILLHRMCQYFSDMMKLRVMLIGTLR